MAEKAYVSTAVATRLAKGNGYSGYTELKYELIKELEVIDKQQEQYSNQVVDKYINAYFTTILNTTNCFDYSLIQDIAKSILKTNEMIKSYGIKVLAFIPGIQNFVDQSITDCLL